MALWVFEPPQPPETEQRQDRRVSGTALPPLAEALATWCQRPQGGVDLKKGFQRSCDVCIWFCPSLGCGAMLEAYLPHDDGYRLRLRRLSLQ